MTPDIDQVMRFSDVSGEVAIKIKNPGDVVYLGCDVWEIRRSTVATFTYIPRT